MNTEQFLETYDRIKDAPDSVERMRRFVLDLAVRGKLVDQDPDDESVSELLNRFAEERKNTDISSRNTSVNLDSLDHAYELPYGWEWSVIECVAQVIMGQSPLSGHCNKTGDGMAFFQGKSDFGNRHPTPRNWCVKPKKIAESGDILISVRAPVGPTNVADQRCCIGRGLAALRPFSGLNREYFLLTLKAFEIDLSSKGYGTTFAAITKKQLTGYNFPLPPLEEQHRIVAKVDELMTLCDRIGHAHTKRESTREKLTVSCLGRLTDSESAEVEFRSHAAFVIDNIKSLTVNIEQIKRLRKTILDLAVRGKLVDQDPDDKSVSELLNRFAEERKNTDISSRNTSVNLDSLDHAYELPYGWEWSVIECVAQVIMGQSPLSGHCNKTGDGMAFFQGKSDFGNRHPTPRNWCVKPKKIAESGDILISVRAPVGPTNVADQRCCIGRGLAALRPFSGLNREYFLLTLKAFEIDLSSKGYGTTFAAITKKQLTGYNFPLPPLEEQHRIVAKVDELMTLCDQLEIATRTTISKRSSLHASILQAFLAEPSIRGVDSAKYHKRRNHG